MLRHITSQPMQTDSQVIRFTAFGVPQPKGSARAFVPKGWTRAVVTSANPKNKGWQQTVAEAAGRAMETSPWDLMQGPVMLTADFYLPRPKSLPKRVTAHIKKPDTDKLVRGLGDSLTHVVWADDSQVVEMHVRKHYAALNEPARVVVTVEAKTC